MAHITNKSSSPQPAHSKKQSLKGHPEAPEGKRAKLANDKSALPIHAHRQEILNAVSRSRVLVLIGETGSGKTTQVPQILYNAGYGRRSIAVTQPRRIAAISIAARVASEMGTKLGELVGFHVRFKSCLSQATRVKFLTDGMLVREAAVTEGITKCGVLIIDEAHERSVNTDVLLGLARRTLEKTPDSNFKVIVMSATIDATPFVDFFGGKDAVRLLAIPGRQHPVQVYYAPTPEPDILEAAMLSVLQIHLWRPHGDILVFLPGQEDIDGLQRLLAEKREQLLARKRGEAPVLQGDLNLPSMSKVDDLVIRPIYAALPFDEQQLVFDPAPPGCRKVILATNIAETSITISGIRYVVDTGLMKLKICHAQNGVEVLKLVETSKASARQRAGRAGREGPGEVYRLYVEAEFEKMPEQTPPEILRCEMATVYLHLRCLGIDMLKFPLVSPPPSESLKKAAQLLCRIGALDSAGAITALGRKLAMLPIHPLQAYFLSVSVEFECVAEVLTIVAMLSAESPVFATTKAEKGGATNAGSASNSKGPIWNEDGDHLALLQVYRQWKKAGQPREFARQHNLNGTTLQHAEDVRSQLKDLVQNSWGVKQISSCGGVSNWAVIRKCLLKACWTQVARLDEVSQTVYTTMVSRQTAKLHPSSALMRQGKHPICVVFHELVTTSRNYLRTVTEVDPSWLVELVPQHFSVRG